MKRKVNLVGKNTLTVSLPTKWVKDNKIMKGEELNFFFDKDKIVFSRSESKKEKKSVSLNIDDYTYITLARHLAVLYKTNFDRITLIYSKTTIPYPKGSGEMNLKKTIQKLVGRLVGAEIISQSSTKTEIEVFATEEFPDLDKIERRIHFLLKETMDELLDAVGKDYKHFHESVYDHHDNIVKFINYFLKVLYKSDRSGDEKKFAFSFYILIDHIVDKIRHVSEKIEKYGCSSKVKKYLAEIFDIFYEELKLVAKKQVPKSLMEKRYRLKEKIDSDSFTVKDLKVMYEVMIMLDTIAESEEYIISKNLEKIAAQG